MLQKAVGTSLLPPSILSVAFSNSYITRKIYIYKRYATNHLISPAFHSIMFESLLQCLNQFSAVFGCVLISSLLILYITVHYPLGQIQYFVKADTHTHTHTLVGFFLVQHNSYAHYLSFKYNTTHQILLEEYLSFVMVH